MTPPQVATAMLDAIAAAASLRLQLVDQAAGAGVHHGQPGSDRAPHIPLHLRELPGVPSRTPRRTAAIIQAPHYDP